MVAAIAGRQHPAHPGRPVGIGGLAPFRNLHRLSWRVAVLLALLALASGAFNAWRTRFLLISLDHRASWRQALLTTIAAEFAGVTTPGAVGMPATYTFLCHNLGLTLGEAVGMVGGDHGHRPDLFRHHYAPGGYPANF